VTTPQTPTRARIGALLLCCVLLPALSGCSVWDRVFHRHRRAGCAEKPFALNTDSRPALKVPEGMSAPDTRNSIRIGDLSDHPERVRAKTEPCLAEPPAYFTTPQKPTPSAVPGSAPVTEMKLPPAASEPAPAASGPAAPAPAPAAPAPAPGNPK
jgi:hypothetical protein